MVFTSAPWCRDLVVSPSETQLVGDFMLEGVGEKFEGKPILVCAQTGRSYTVQDLEYRVTMLARSLAQVLGWNPNEGSPENKVVGILAFNAMDFVPLSWAIHRIGGTCLLLHPTSSAIEIQTLMRKANCHALFTCRKLQPVCEAVFTALNQDLARLFLLELAGDDATPAALKTVSQLIADGEHLPALEPVALQAEGTQDRLAYLCPTSGTSGYQKLAQITHASVVVNTLQAITLDTYATGPKQEVVLGILPLTHAFGLLMLHVMICRRDTTILHATFDMQAALRTIQQYRIERLYLVPAILAALVNNPILFKMADLSSVQSVVCGSAPLSADMVRALKQIRPDWNLLPGYGLTEAAVFVSCTSQHSIFPGSVGSLLPQVQVRLLDADGAEIQDYDMAGDLYLRSPSDGWLVTGDVACMRRNTDGEEHLFIVDRKKDIMKVKGIQVAPVEIEAQLLNHPAVDEAAVFGVQHDEAGERPFAFVVRSRQVNTEMDEQTLREALAAHIQDTLSEPFWLRENIRFLEAIPKSHSGKALKFKLKELV
ncbi:AMP dependent ligase/synthetase [Penicillium concentricum]|uniref:AMP dependent ligase/synthetase n=1 Tax=Penicillium concentricum TaxID=293559 RepID=A0A9W9S960_9EURO|nr:AMP dependent ligase/synthetase [Penicillium concentricum]KAJ5374362.1 AMP dependent ligase/synthetase [Penicillium concentricum]